MMMKSWILLLSVAAFQVLCTESNAQRFNFGSTSESGRFNAQIRAGNSTEFFTNQVLTRDRSVANGFGVPVVSASSGAGPANKGAQLVAPRQSATFGVGNASSGAKPFSTVSRSPTVSPYLNLFREDFEGSSDLNYQTLVRPQLQQRAMNQQFQTQQIMLNQQVNAMAARNAYNATGNQGAMATGHPTAYRNHSRFYPALSTRPRR